MRGGDNWHIPGCDGDRDRFQTPTDTEDLSGDIPGGQFRFYVTQDIRDWFDGEPMEGWLLKSTYESWNPFNTWGYYQMESKESTYGEMNHRPYLRIIFRRGVDYSVSSSTTSGTVTRRWGEKSATSFLGRPSPQPEADNYNNVTNYASIKEEFPDTTYSDLIVSSPEQSPYTDYHDIRALIQFDLNNLYKAVEDSSDIYSAKLKMKCNGLEEPEEGSPKYPRFGGKISVHRIGEQWDEDYVTYNSRMAGRGWHDRGGTFHQSPTDEVLVLRPSFPYEWDVTDDVKDFVDGARDNYGWIITKYTEIWLYAVGFYEPGASDSTTRPYLEIEYNQRSSVSSSSVSSSSESWSSSSSSTSSSSTSFSSSSTSTPFNPVTETWGDSPSAAHGPVTGDALLNADETSRNYGGVINNRVGLDDVAYDEWQTVIKFDTSNLLTLSETGTSADIVSASLYMYQYGGGASTEWGTVNMYRINKDWNEGVKTGSGASTGEVTYDSARHNEELWTSPGAQARPDDREWDLTDVEYPRYNGWYSWNVSEDIKYFMTNPTSAFGWVLEDKYNTIGNHKDFASRNYTADVSRRPYLSIVYNKSSSSSSVSSSSSSSA